MNEYRIQYKVTPHKDLPFTHKVENVFLIFTARADTLTHALELSDFDVMNIVDQDFFDVELTGTNRITGMRAGF